MAMSIVISIILIVVILAVIGTKSLYDFNLKNQARLSFGKAFKRTGTPIITLKDRTGKAFNFLIDTGSNMSHLKLGVINGMADTEKVIPVDSEGNKMERKAITTANGEVMPDEYYRLTLFNGDKMFVEVFEVFDLGDAFDGWGIEIHGILGNTFLEKYKYVIDFKDKKMYIK